MRLSFGLEQKMMQKQILAPRMIQSMEILQLPLQELQERIEQELNENPILELAETDRDSSAESVESVDGVDHEHPDAPTDTEKELVVSDDSTNTDDFERLLEIHSEWPDHFDDRSRTSSGRMDEEGDRKHDALANLVARTETLQDALELQLRELEITPELRLMAERIISSLDGNGYLTTSLEDLLPPDTDSETLRLAHEALSVVQSLEPAGIGARDLRECLLLQLRPAMPFYEELATLISNHLDDLKDNRLPAIQRKTGYTIERIQLAWSELRRLNPKPGAMFAQSTVPTVTPDVLVEKDDQGRYVVQLEDDRTPTLRISNYYRQRLMDKDTTPAEREFIKRKVTSAQWLIESIQQRRSTLTRVSQAIVDHQIRFLEEGPEAIEPLKMQQVADKVGIHVTTVSRAVDDKWIQTPRGLFPLKRFFVGGTTSADGEEVAWDAIRIRLQEVVDHEDKQNPFSDDDLVKQLAIHGLTVARRTVTKYRQKMGIPSSRQRRDWSMN